MVHPGSNRLILSSRRVVTSDEVAARAVVIEGGRIAQVVPLAEIPAGQPVEDLGNLVIMAGLVDSHVHINDPGRSSWEGGPAATRGAAAGGITTLVDMPLNSLPVTTGRAALQLKRSTLDGAIHVDCAFHGGLVNDNLESLGGLVEAGVCGIKAFLIDSGIDEFPAVKPHILKRALVSLAGTRVPLLAHAELAPRALLPAPSSSVDRRKYAGFLNSRPDDWEVRAIQLLIDLCRSSLCPTHIVHLSSCAALPLLRSARAEGLPISVETCPHYLFFSADGIADGETLLKCAPPIRNSANREQLWEALEEGLIDLVVSDHSPAPPEMKELATGDFLEAWGGISSLQLSLPAFWTGARKRGFSLTDLTRWMARNPARLAGLQEKGKLAPGSSADLVVWDPEAVFTPSESMLYHRHRISPYLGRELTGRVERTYLRGLEIYRRGQDFPAPAGRLLTRHPGGSP